MNPKNIHPRPFADDSNHTIDPIANHIPAGNANIRPSGESR